MKTIYFLRKVLFLISVLLFANTVIGQTTLISSSGDGGFETGADFSANGWTVVNSTVNTWQTSGVAVPFAGTRSAFISNDGGTTYAYSTSPLQTSHFYRDVTVPEGETQITLSFQWKGNGESAWDRLLVYTAPTTVTPVINVPASNSSTLTGATLVFTQTTFPQSSYIQKIIVLPASLAGTTFRLIFTWQNDSSYGTSPAVSVDDISLVSSLPTPLMGVKGNGVAIADGDVTPSTADNTDFGSVVEAGGAFKSITYSITNTGLASLNLTGTPIVAVSGPNASDFTVSVQPTTPVAATTGTTTFTVDFNPSATGVRNATISISNDDLTANPYDFDIVGNGAAALSGSYTINNTLPTGGTNFASFTDAINALNIGITSAVTFNVECGQVFNEKPPVVTVSGTAINTVTFQKSGIGANPKLTPVGTLSVSPYDFGICISGGDYITFDGIDIDASSATSTTSAIEYGYLIRNASATDGAQYN